MKKQMEMFDTLLDREIQKTMTKEFPLPEKVKQAQDAAFARIREMQAQTEGETGENLCPEKPEKKRGRRRLFLKTCAGFAAAAAVFCVVCITNPAFAAQIPLVGRVFETVGDSLGFSGDYREYAKPLEEADQVDKGNAGAKERAAQSENAGYSQTKNGTTVTLSEVYCNDAALYLSMVIQSEDEFPDTLSAQNGNPLLYLWDSTIAFDYNSKERLLAAGGSECLDGKFVDKHTYAGVIRYDLSDSEDASDYEAYEEKRTEFFIQSLGISKQELEQNPSEAYEKVCQILNIDELTDETLEEAVAQAGGPNWKDYQKEVQVPEHFQVQLSIPMLVGNKIQVTAPEMPADIWAEYEKGMKAQGLGLSDEDYANFTDEQKEIEHEFFTKMWNQYGVRFPEINEHPNKYENWWTEGPWEFSLEVDKNGTETIVKEIHDIDENGLGLESVTKTPFEIIVDDGQANADYFTVALDADGDILDYGTNSNTNTFAVQDRDVSKIDVYICDYIEYMDELKGYYWSDDYEVHKKEKTFAQLLDERALYHKEIIFEE